MNSAITKIGSELQMQDEINTLNKKKKMMQKLKA